MDQQYNTAKSVGESFLNSYFTASTNVSDIKITIIEYWIILRK